MVVLLQMHDEDSLLELAGAGGGVGVIRERETVDKAAVGGFDVAILLAVLLEFAVAFDGQCAVFQGDPYVLSLHLRQLGFDPVPLGGFGDVHQRDPLGHPEGFVAALGPGDLGAAKKAAQTVPQVHQFAQLIPMC